MPRKLTNKKNLPLPLYLAIKNDTYEARGHISTTTLIDSPYVRLLKKYNEYEDDAADSIWSLTGQAMHSVVERVGTAFEGNRFMAEHKLLIKASGYTHEKEIELSGTSDLIEITSEGEVILHDFKNVFVYVVKQGTNSSAYKKWILQLNVYRYMIKQCLDLEVTKIYVHAFLRDWSRNRSEWQDDYPEYPVETFSIPAYSHKSMLDYIKKRIDLHFTHEEDYKKGFRDNIPVCAEEDRWKRPEVWKMLKLGGKRSLKNFVINDTSDEENAKVYYAMKSKEVDKLTIEKVKGEDVRCVNYCPVNMFCKYYKATYLGKENKPKETEDGAGVTNEISVTVEEQKQRPPDFNFDL